MCDGCTAAGGLLAHRLGGGFQIIIPADEVPRFRLVSEGEEEVWETKSITVADGSRMKVYPLGAGSWMWDEVTETGLG